MTGQTHANCAADCPHERRECVGVTGADGEERPCNGAHAGMCVAGECNCYSQAG